MEAFNPALEQKELKKSSTYIFYTYLFKYITAFAMLRYNFHADLVKPLFIYDTSFLSYVSNLHKKFSREQRTFERYLPTHSVKQQYRRKTTTIYSEEVQVQLMTQ